MRTSVIIPALNEESCIQRCLHYLARHDPHEIIVVDGGSVDNTRKLARDRAAVIDAPRGRAVQMNAGAEIATGDVFFFLHADTLLPKNALQTIRLEMQDPNTQAGIFRLSFNQTSPLLHFYAACTRIPVPHICFGDRGLFIRKSQFEKLGGYPKTPIFEDIEMARRLHALGGFRYLSNEVTTSARRFEEHGEVIQQLRNIALYAGYLSNVSPHRLARFYDYTV